MQQLSTSYFKEIGKQHNQPRFVRSVKDKSKQWSHEKIWYAEGRQAESIEPDLSFKPLKIEQHCRKYDAVLYSSSEEEASHGYTGSPSLPVTRWHVMAFSWSLDLQANDYVILAHGRPLLYHSLGTRPSKNRKESGKSAEVEVYTAPGMQAHFRIGFWLAFWCALIRNTNCTRAVFAFCFVLERCETKRVRLERLLQVSGLLLATEGYTINKIPNISQCTLPPSLGTRLTSTPPRLPDPPFDFSRVWFRDYLDHTVITAQFTFNIAESELHCGMLLDLACKTRATIDIRARTVSS